MVQCVSMSWQTPIKLHLLFIVIFLISGCTTITHLGDGYDQSGSCVYLSAPETLKESFSELVVPEADFWKTEDAKIQYLIKRIRISKLGFERNGKKYSPGKAATFILWKKNLAKWNSQVHSAQDLVDVVCSGSATSGQPYRVICDDGTQHNLQSVLQNELNALEEYLIEYRAQKAEEALLEKVADSTEEEQALSADEEKESVLMQKINQETNSEVESQTYLSSVQNIFSSFNKKK